MHKARITLTAIATTLVCCTSISHVSATPTPSSTDPSNSLDTSISGNPSRAIPLSTAEEKGKQDPSKNEQLYSDEDLLYYLVFADGRVEDENPGLSEELGFIPFPENVDRRPVEQLLADYYSANQEEASAISNGLRSGQPHLVEAAMMRFSESFNAFAQEKAAARMSPDQQVTTLDSGNLNVYHQGYGYLWGAVAVAVYGAVALFHAATAITVIFYLPEDLGGASELEREEIVASLTEVLRD